MKERPNLFTYDDYRKYLQDWFAWMKEAKTGFSFRAFSLWAGFKSPNQLMLVMQGKRAISFHSIGRYFQVLKLKETEKKYFELLVKFNQAKDMVTKSDFFRQLSVHWVRRGTQLESEQYKYLTNWFYTAIREMVNLKEFRESGTWISKKLGGLVTPAQAKTAIAILEDLKLLERDADNRLRQTSHYVTTGNEAASVAGYLYHEQMMQLAIDALKNKPSSQRNLTALTFTIRKKDYETIVGEINEFRKRIISSLQNRENDKEDEELYQLNIHLFPIRKGA